MGDPITDLRDARPFSNFLSLITADALVITRPWSRRVAKGAVTGLPLTRSTLGEGSWILAAQCSYSIGAAEEVEFEIKLNLRVVGDDPAKPFFYGFAYHHFTGSEFGTATVIGAVTLEKIASVELTYDTQIMSQPPDSYPPSCSPDRPIITAIRVPSLFAVA